MGAAEADENGPSYENHHRMLDGYRDCSHRVLVTVKAFLHTRWGYVILCVCCVGVSFIGDYTDSAWLSVMSILVITAAALVWLKEEA